MTQKVATPLDLSDVDPARRSRLLGRIAFLLASSPFRRRSTWGRALVVMRDREMRVTSRGDYAAWLRAHDLEASAVECLHRRVPPGAILIWADGEGDDAHEAVAGFGLIDLSRELRGFQNDTRRALLSIERASAMLAEASSVDEVKNIRDVAVAMRAYGRTQKAGKAIINDAWEIIYRADTRLGELSRDLPKAAPPVEGTSRAPGRTLPVSKVAALADAGMTTQRASECEQAASLPEKDQKAYVAACRKAEQAPTTAGAVALARLDAPVRKQVLQVLVSEPALTAGLTHLSDFERSKRSPTRKIP